MWVEWSSCMFGNGFDFANRVEVSDFLARETLPMLDRFQVVGTPTTEEDKALRSDIDAFVATEAKIAQVDIDCAEDVSLDLRLGDVRTELEESWLADNADAIALALAESGQTD